jgi:hypothetical protein
MKLGRFDGHPGGGRTYRMRAHFLVVMVLLGTAFSARGAESLAFSILDTGWFFTVHDSGRLDAQYGSSALDHMSLPPGSVNFPVLKALIEPRLGQTGAADSAQVAFSKGTTGSSQMRSLRDDVVLRYLVLTSFENWELMAGADRARMRDLHEKLRTALLRPSP